MFPSFACNVPGAFALMVMPLSRSRSIEFQTCSCSLAARAPGHFRASIGKCEICRVMCAMIQKGV